MFKKIFTTIKTPRNFWRSASFSEVGQLYAARMMRTVAINLGAAFMSVYMLKSGYSIAGVSLFWVGYFGFKVLIMMPLAQMIANIGPKKAIFISNFLYIPSMVAFMFLGELGLLSLLLTATFQSASAALYDMGYLVSFSRLNNNESAGREVAFMNIAEKIAKGLSPLIGGLLAMYFDPRASIAASIIFFIFAAWPLMRTADSMTTGFRLAPKGFPWKTAWQSLVMQLPIGFDIYASGTAWSLFLASLIFTAGGNQVYAELGLLTSLILAVSLVSTHVYGKLIDKKAGGQLLVWSAIGNAITYVFRAVTRTPSMAVGTNAANEMMMTGYSMAFLRGMFDVANQTGCRVFYVGMSQLLVNLGSLVAAITLAGVMIVLDTSSGFFVFYIATAAIVALIALSKFRVYKRA